MNQHPEWSYGAVLYEMNVRQLTPEGTLRAAAARLEFLRDLGVDAVWLMPIYPIGEKNRKGRSAPTIRSATTAPSIPSWARWTISTTSWPKRTASA